MAAEAHDNENEDFNTPHLPERYHLTVKAKKRQRLKKQVLMAGAAVIVIALMYFLLSWAAGGLFSGMQASSPVTATGSVQSAEDASGAATMNSTGNTTPAFRQGAALTPPLPAGVIAPDAAVAALQAGYPAADYTIIEMDLTQSHGRPLYRFDIEPSSGSSSLSPIFVDAATGSFYSPGEETAGIPRDNAEQRARAAFPALGAERCTLTFTTNNNGQKLWEYSLHRGSHILATGTLDAETGEMIASARVIQPENRPAVPVLDTERALAVADRYIIDKNGGQLPLNMSRSYYEPAASSSGIVAGQYVFVYERMFQDIPTDVDGFIVTVDAVTGEVTGYTRQWTTPEHAFSASAQPDIIRREATFAVLQKAKEQYPEYVGGLRIISADIRWKNEVPYGTVPRPGTIPLAWKVIFDDEVIRADASAQPAVAWVDAQSGEFLAFEYRH